MAIGDDTIANSILSPKCLNHLNVKFYQHSPIVPSPVGIQR